MTALLDLAGESRRTTRQPVAFNPFAPQFLADPYPTYHRLRRDSPFFGVQGCMGKDWIATTHATVVAILADTRFGIDNLPERIRAAAARQHQARSVEPLCTDLSRWLFFIDTPGHAAVRKSLSGLFRRAALDRLAPLISRQAQAVIGRHLPQGGLDVVADLAAYLPVYATCSLLGIENADLACLADLSSGVFEVFAQPLSLRRYQTINTKLRALHGLIDRLAGLQPQEAPGALSELRRQVSRGTITQQEWLAFCGMLFSVGQDTALGLIANAVLTLVQNKDAVLRTIPVDRPPPMSLLRELARFNAPVQMIVRVAHEDCDIAGAHVRSGERVHLFLGSALHDEAVFADPGRFDPERASSSGLHFGSGLHFCLGSQLALLQLEAVVGALLPVLAKLEVDETTFKWLSCTHLRRPQEFRLLVSRTI